MCTQNGHAVHKEHSHGGGGHVRRDMSACERTVSSNKSRSSGSHWHLKTTTSCSSSDIDIEVRCLIVKQSISAVKCRHILCLLLAYFAVSASAEVSTSPYTDLLQPTTLIPNVKLQHTSSPDKKVSSTPLREIKNDHEFGQKELVYSSTPVPVQGIFTTTHEIPPRSRGNISHIDHDLPSHGPVKAATLYNHSINIDKEESRYFIENIFHRYSSSSFLLKEDLEKLFVNIGLTGALNKSGVSLKDGEVEEDSHRHGDSIHQNHELYHQTHHEHLRDADIVVGSVEHDIHHSSNTTSLQDSDISPSGTHSQQEQLNSERLQNNLTALSSAASRLSRSTRNYSHQPEQHNKCLSRDELLRLFGYDTLNKINVDQFRHLCPALIDQLDAGHCRQNHEHEEGNGHTHEHENEHHHHTDGHTHDEGDMHNHDEGGDNKHGEQHGQTEGVTLAVWFYALLSVAVISLCSVAGVVVIPNMKRVFYNHILQFLVALAVGAMSGDAMLHLLPHAMLSDSHHHSHDIAVDMNETHNHDEPHAGETSSHLDGLYKGLVALMGIYSFFFLERLFTLFTSSRSDRKGRKQKPRRKCRQGHKQKSQVFHMVNSRLENDGGNTPSCEEMVMVVHPNKALRAYADVSHEAYLHRCDEALVHPASGYSVTTILSQGDDHMITDDAITLEGITNTGLAVWDVGRMPAVASDAEVVGINKDAEAVPSIHSHSHSHLAPDFVGPLSSVAMMVIVGDMIHNFCDGLAIGAAYAGSVAGGLSTSVAVFCHELPHEIGDFAVLVRSGLTMKKAVYFNLISSIPCFIGVTVGLTVGNAMSTSSWIFAGVGGMFLYVTLVDLIPEMSSVYTKCGEPWFLHLLLQASGIAVGTTIMLVISVYEESLLTAFK